MFNIGSGEIALIAVVALLILGPSRLPELARGIGKFVREFRRHTDDVRGVVEREFYRMDQELGVSEPSAPSLTSAQGATPAELGHPNRSIAPLAPLGKPLSTAAAAPTSEAPAGPASEALPEPEPVRSQVSGGMPDAASHQNPSGVSPESAAQEHGRDGRPHQP